MASPEPDSPRLVTAVALRELPRVPDPARLVLRLREGGLPWWLDSALESRRLGRFSFVGADPYLVVRARGTEAWLECRRDVRPDLAPGRSTRVGDPLELVRSLLPSRPAVSSCLSALPFVGGAVGYWGYELAARIESIPLVARDDLGLPDLALLFVDRLVAIDHQQGRAFAIGLGFASAEGRAARDASRACREIARAAADVPPAAETLRRAAWRDREPAASPEEVEATFDCASYGRAVEAILEEIAAGNVYQANLTHRMELPLPGVDPFVLYRELREQNPAPFAAYLELPEAAILSSSPERFLRLDAAGGVESRPIKGTRPRGRTAEEDRRERCALLQSEKDRAENLMIVDLVRNDLGRVCRTGSVAVPELMRVESYATVHQMVSTISGRLRPECDAIDLVRAAFPPAR